MERIPEGTWVQILATVLPPEGRAPQVPDDTKKVPLDLRVKGFLTASGRLNETVTVKTVTGRLVTGQLVDAAPTYRHSFGEAVPEMQRIGVELREFLAKGGRQNG